jgi:hypothetical protein
LLAAILFDQNTSREIAPKYGRPARIKRLMCLDLGDLLWFFVTFIYGLGVLVVIVVLLVKRSKINKR